MYKVATILGIRPDAIRTSELIKRLDKHKDIKHTLVWTGQHYDEKLKGVFFKQLGLNQPTVELDTAATTHNQQHVKLIDQLDKFLTTQPQDAVIFLGDANAVMGCIAPLKLNIPIVHIEAGQRSFDFNMPEERNRVVIDRVSDLLFAYHENSKNHLVREGIDPEKVIVCGNTIVEVLNAHAESIDANPILKQLGLTARNYAVQTLHRDGHMNDPQYCLDLLRRVNGARSPPM